MKKKYKVEVEGVVTRTYEVEADNSAKAAQLGRSEFVIEFGGDKDAVHVGDIWKEDPWNFSPR